MKMVARVSEKGQVTIPKRLRERMGIGPGDLLEFHEESGSLIATKSLAMGRLRHMFGILRLEGSVDEAIDEMRGPAELP
jgi:AbrB family looped-hinge helix DNA binding protein